MKSDLMFLASGDIILFNVRKFLRQYIGGGGISYYTPFGNFSGKIWGQISYPPFGNFSGKLLKPRVS
jgi:hypothetical protein